MAKFPKTLFVKTEKDGSTKYFVADANAACLVEMGDKIAIATYQLVGVRAAEGVVLWLSEVLASRGSSQLSNQCRMKVRNDDHADELAADGIGTKGPANPSPAAQRLRL